MKPCDDRNELLVQFALNQLSGHFRAVPEMQKHPVKRSFAGRHGSFLATYRPPALHSASARPSETVASSQT